jgi:hypothetical protein
MAGIIGSLSINQQLELIYIGYYGRAADPGGFNFWTNQDSQALDSSSRFDVCDSLYSVAT